VTDSNPFWGPQLALKDFSSPKTQLNYMTLLDRVTRRDWPTLEAFSNRRLRALAEFFDLRAPANRKWGSERPLIIFHVDFLFMTALT
jgi:hypothetical protein